MKSIKLAADMRDLSQVGCAMEEASSSIRKAVTTKGSGRRTKWMAGASCFMLIIAWPMRATGHKMNSMASARFIMTTPSHSTPGLITQISISCKTIGNIMRGCW